MLSFRSPFLQFYYACRIRYVTRYVTRKMRARLSSPDSSCLIMPVGENAAGNGTGSDNEVV